VTCPVKELCSWAVRDVDGFGERYRAARQMLLEYWADQIIEIADDGELDPRDRQIRTSVRQWLMSKFALRRYGDKMQIAGDPDSPFQIMHRESLNLGGFSAAGNGTRPNC